MTIFSNVWNKINKEVLAGLTTFFTMSYIVVVNPLIWSTPGTGVSLSFALTATVIVIVVLNLLAGFFIKLPYAFAPGMGLNAFVVYTMILSQKIPFPTALGVMFWSGILFVLISILPIRKKIIEALPENMKHAMCCGVGLFLAFIGFKNLNFIVANETTLVQFGHINIKILFGFIGFLIAFYLFMKEKSYAFLVSIVSVTILAIFTGQTALPNGFFLKPNLSHIFKQIDILGAFKLSLIPTILTLLMTNLFDSISTIVAISKSSPSLQDKNGSPLQLNRILSVDSFGSLFSSLIGTSPTAVYIESASGIQAGGRTGIVPIVVALCFLPCLFFEPIIRIIPAYATAPILIFIGILMSLHLKHIKIENFDDVVPVFLTIILMPLTSSITYGVIFGIISYVVMKILVGKYNQIPRTLWGLALISFFVFFSAFTNKKFESELATAQFNAQKNHTLSANFKQEFYSALRDKTTVSSGKLLLKDDFFRWEIDAPRKQLYVNDGKFIWKFEQEFNHVEKFDLSTGEIVFLKILSHIEDFQKYYNVTEGTESNSKEGLLNLVLEPKEKNPDQRSINLFIQTKTGYITELNMVAANGNKTKFLFDDFSKENLKQDLFVFVPPKDVIVQTFKPQ